MPGNIIAIVHYAADPDFMPHMRRQAGTLHAHGYGTWGIGVAHPFQKKHVVSPYARKDVIDCPGGFERGPLGALYFMLKVFLLLWQERPILLQPIDVQALVPCYLHAVLRSIPLHYLALEEVAVLTTLVDRHRARKTWVFLEGWCIRRAASVAVVAEIDACSFRKRYRIPKPYVIRNVPELTPPVNGSDLELRKRFGWSAGDTVLMYHGVIDAGRGIELAFPIMKKRPELLLAVAGYGEHEGRLKEMAREQGLDDRIGWVGPFMHDELPRLVQDADIGIILFENLSGGLYQAFPCKLFEYVHSGVPVIASNFPEMKSYIESTDVGLTVDINAPDEIEAAFSRMLDDQAFYSSCRQACMAERERTNWQTESSVYLAFLGLTDSSSQAAAHA